jgi:hypothetical protein
MPATAIRPPAAATTLPPHYTANAVVNGDTAVRSRVCLRFGVASTTHRWTKASIAALPPPPAVDLRQPPKFEV